MLIHEVSHLLRDHESRRKSAAATDERLWNTAGDCEINDDLAAEGLPLPGDPPQPAKFGLDTGASAEVYYHRLYKPAAARRGQDHAARNGSRARRTARSGAHGERRSWELPDEDERQRRGARR